MSVIDLSNYIVRENELLSTAVGKMCSNEKKGLVVVNEEEIAVGTFTRNDLLKCSHCFGLQDVSIKNYYNSNFDYCIDHVEPKFMASTHAILPILDTNKRVIDILFPHITHVRKRKQYPVVIIAGGKGTRLYPYTKILPKPLVPVLDDTPMVEMIINSFYDCGVDDFYMIINYKKEMIKEYFDSINKNYNLTFKEEMKPLGTGGGLCYLRSSLTSTFYLTNCDILMLEDYDDVYKFHKQSGNLITMIVSLKAINIPYGVVKADDRQNLVKTIEKPTYMVLVNTGIYLVEPEVYNYIQDEENIDFPSIVERVKNDNKKVGIYPITSDRWLDMGQVDELQKTKQILVNERRGKFQ